MQSFRRWALVSLLVLPLVLAASCGGGSDRSGDSGGNGDDPGEPAAGTVSGYVYRTVHPGETSPGDTPPGLFPVSGATVEVTADDEDSDGSPRQRTPSQSATTDSEGFFELSGVEPGESTLRVTKSGFEQIETAAQVEEDGETTVFPRTSDAGYLPLENGVDLQVTSDPPGASVAFDGVATGVTTPFSFRDLPPGTFSLLTYEEGHSVPDPRQVVLSEADDSGQVEDIDLQPLPEELEDPELPPRNQSGDFPEVNSNYRVVLRRGESDCPGDLGEGMFVASLSPGDRRMWHISSDGNQLTVDTTRGGSNTNGEAATGQFQNTFGDFSIDFSEQSGSAGPLELTGIASISGRINGPVAAGTAVTDFRDDTGNFDCSVSFGWIGYRERGVQLPDLPPEISQPALPEPATGDSPPRVDRSYEVTLRPRSSDCPGDLADTFYTAALGTGDSRIWHFTSDGAGNLTMSTVRGGENPEGRIGSGAFDNAAGDFSVEFSPESGAAGQLVVTGLASVSGRVTNAGAGGTATGSFDGEGFGRDVSCEVSFFWFGEPVD